MLILTDVIEPKNEKLILEGYRVDVEWEYFSGRNLYWSTSNSERELSEVTINRYNGELTSLGIVVVDQILEIPSEQLNLLEVVRHQEQGLPCFKLTPEPSFNRYYVRENFPLVVSIASDRFRVWFGEEVPVGICITSNRVRFGTDNQEQLRVVELFNLSNEEIDLIKSTFARGG
jgi:hypothetical protein